MVDLLEFEGAGGIATPWEKRLVLFSYLSDWETERIASEGNFTSHKEGVVTKFDVFLFSFDESF